MNDTELISNLKNNYINHEKLLNYIIAIQLEYVLNLKNKELREEEMYNLIELLKIKADS